jgi:DNA-binding transcriptional MocR family regulator
MPNASPWTDRVWHEFRAGNLTRAYRDVLLTLRTFRGSGGLICPSHATLADRAGCVVRTVQRALQQAQTLGLVSWGERRVRAAWRWLRTSNAYRLELPTDHVRPGMRPAFRRSATTGQNGRGGESLDSKKTALAGLLREAAALPDLLAARRNALAAIWAATA